MLDNIHWLGHDSFRLDGSVTVYIDPWKLPAGQPRADVILVTHEHFDHLSPDDIAKIAGPDTVVVGPAAVTGQVSGLETVTVAAGDSVDVRGLTVRWSPPTTSTSSARRASRTTRASPATSATSSRWTASATTTPATPTRYRRCRTCTATSRFCPSAARTP